MKFGINLLLWTDDPTQAKFYALYERLAGLGFDGLELPIFDGDPERFAKLGAVLRDLGLECTATSAMDAEHDPISRDPAIRAAALSALKQSVDCCEAAGAALLGGPLYAAIGEFSGTGPSAEEKQFAANTLRDAADYAAQSNIGLTLEFLNRFEIYLLNSAADTTALIKQIDRPNVTIHYDTFHAHIEEKSITQAIASNADFIGHVHLSENDRGTPGAGQVAWAETFSALREMDYDGWLTIEAFGQGLPALAAATKIWRPLFDSEEQLARDGLKFIKDMYQQVAS